MSAVPDGRLERLFGGNALVSLRKRLRQRFERAAVDGGVESFRLSNLTADEHAALASLLGRSVRFTNSMQVDVQAIDDSLRRAGIAPSLRAALERIDGPIVHLKTSRQEWEALWAGVIAACDHPSLRAFLQTPAGLALLKRLSSGKAQSPEHLCADVETVLKTLPANGTPRAQLAANTLGDAHALDNGRPVATLVLAIWRDIIAPLRDADETSSDSQDGNGDRREVTDERAREIWARAGVLVNELARPALILNLRARGIPAFAEATGEPTHVSLRFLLRASPSWAVSAQDVFVCENPNLLAIAADKLGTRCAPLACTDGMPAAAQRTLLTQLAQAGASLRYHGDFDWPGVRIGNHVIGQHGALAWRFGADDYVAAIRSAPRPGRRLEGPETAASWDKSLEPAMRAHQQAIAEEFVVDKLLDDLEWPSAVPSSSPAAGRRKP
jgi:uncharacterized protein (TIGR02679 family)